jgi:hypothetical protein
LADRKPQVNDLVFLSPLGNPNLEDYELYDRTDCVNRYDPHRRFNLMHTCRPDIYPYLDPVDVPRTWLAA